MAYPVTLSINSFAAINPSPVKIGSAYYLFARKSGTVGKAIFKASDPSGTWTIQDEAGVGSATFDTAAWYVDGTTIHIVTVSHSATTGSVRYHTFDTSTDTWGITEETIVSGVDNTDSNMPTVPAIGVRSDGDVVVVYQGGIETIMGADYERAYLAERISGTWTVDIRIDAQGKIASSFYSLGGILADQTNDRFHAGYFDSPNSDFNISTFPADYNTNGWTNGQQDATADATMVGPGYYNYRNTRWVAFTDTTRKIRVTYVDDQATDKLAVIGFNDSATPSPSQVASVINDANSVSGGDSSTAFAVDGTTQHAIFVDSIATTTIRHDQTGAGDDTWGTDTTVRTTSGIANVKGAVVWDTELAYIFVDGSTEYIDAISLTVAATATAAQTLQSPSQSGVGIEHPEGAGAQTLALLAETGSAEQQISGTSAQSLGIFSQSGAGSALTTIPGSGAQSIVAPAQSGDGAETIAASGQQNVQASTQSGAALMHPAGTGAGVLAAPQQSASGTHTQQVSGAAAQSLALLAESGSAAEAITGLGAQSIAALAEAGAGMELFTGLGAQAMALPSQAGAGGEAALGAADQAIVPATQVASGIEQPDGAGAQILPAPTQSAAATSGQTITASGAQSLAPPAQAGTGVEHPQGQAAQLLPQLTHAATGDAGGISAVAGQTLSGPTQSAIAAEILIATGASLMAEFTQFGSGLTAIPGAGQQIVGAPVQAGLALMQPEGAGIQFLAALDQDAAGQEIAAGAAASLIAALVQSGSGAPPFYQNQNRTTVARRHATTVAARSRMVIARR